MDTRRIPNAHPVFDDEAETNVHDRALLDSVDECIETKRRPENGEGPAIVGSPVISVDGDMAEISPRVVVHQDVAHAAMVDDPSIGDRPTLPSSIEAPLTPPPVAAPAPAPRLALAPLDLTPAAMARPMIRRQHRDAPPPSVFVGASRLGAILAAAALLMTLVAAAFLLLPRRGDLRVALSTERGSVERAEVLVDGQLRCEVAPCVVRNLAAGDHDVVVRAPGYRSSGAHVETVRAGKERLAIVALTVDLESTSRAPEVGALRVTADHEGVRVSVDGVDRGPAPLELRDLKPGLHQVRLTGGNAYDARDEAVDIRAGETRDLGLVRLSARPQPSNAE